MNRTLSALDQSGAFSQPLSARFSIGCPECMAITAPLCKLIWLGVFSMLSARRFGGKKKSVSTRPPTQHDKLKGGLFRRINELLYTHSSGEFLQLQKANKKWNYADKYHEGYDQQIAKWPKHPLTKICLSLRKTYAKVRSDRPVIIDMGCGSCRLWHELRDAMTVISVDFAPPVDRAVLPEVREKTEEYLANGGLIVAPMSATGLPNQCADAIVYSLSLMGTDWPEFLAEGFRLLKSDGRIIIAEVTSRIARLNKLLRSLKKAGLEYSQKEEYDAGYFTLLTLRRREGAETFETEFVAADLLTPCRYTRKTGTEDAD